MTVGYGLWGLRLADWKSDEITEAMVTYLLKTQTEEGYWTGQVIRPPLEESYFTATVLAIQGMKRYATDKQKSSTEAVIAKAQAWLTTTAAKDREDNVFKLWGLSILEDKTKEIAAARQAVLADQREDGGLQEHADVVDFGGLELGFLQALDCHRRVLAPLNASFHRSALAFEDSGTAQLVPDHVPSLAGLVADRLRAFLFHRDYFFPQG